MTNEEINDISSYVFGNIPFEYQGTKRFSTLQAGLRDARQLTKRNLTDGKYNPEIPTGDEGNWLAAIGYFTVLDQMGACFKPAGSADRPNNDTEIKFAIEKFGYDLINNNERELFALISLRNAFTHDFNLLNKPRNPANNAIQLHKFTVVKDINKWVVKLPVVMWDGDIDNKNFLDTKDSTFVNLFGFGELVEEIYRRICQKLGNGSLEIMMPAHTLINKYTFITSRHPLFNSH